MITPNEIHDFVMRKPGDVLILAGAAVAVLVTLFKPERKCSGKCGGRCQKEVGPPPSKAHNQVGAVSLPALMVFNVILVVAGVVVACTVTGCSHRGQAPVQVSQRFHRTVDRAKVSEPSNRREAGAERLARSRPSHSPEVRNIRNRPPAREARRRSSPAATIKETVIAHSSLTTLGGTADPEPEAVRPCPPVDVAVSRLKLLAALGLGALLGLILSRRPRLP